MDSRSRIEEWFRLYSDDVYHFLVSYTGTWEVEDLLQEVFIKAFKKFGTYNGDAAPRTWLYAIARNTAIDEKRKRRVTPAFQPEWLPELSSVDKTPEQQALEREERKELYERIAKLKRNYREVIWLRHIEGLSVSQTAHILHWSETKVSRTLHRAIRALQRNPEGGERDGRTVFEPAGLGNTAAGGTSEA